MTILARPTLRALSASDRGRVVELTTATGLFRPEELDVAAEVITEATTPRPEAEIHYFTMGAELDGLLAGWICWGRTPCTVATWDLYWLAVDPTAQGLGIGTMLVEAMERELAGRARLVVVNTSGRPDYQATRAFYAARGYPAISVVPDYYAPGDDLVIHLKRL